MSPAFHRSSRCTLSIVSLLFAAACGGAQTPPENAGAPGEHHGAHGDHHGGPDGPHGEHGEHHDEHADHGGPGERHELEGSLKAFHDVLAPAWHSEPGKARVTAGCAKAAELRPLAASLETSPPASASADAEGWKTDSKTLESDVDALVTACAAAGQADAEPALAKVHEGFHKLMERGTKH